MALDVSIKKEFSGFALDMKIKSDAGRIGILGASGSGKSMTLKTIAGIVTPDEGQIRVDGITLFDSAKKVNLKPQKRNIGYLFQNYALFPTMTVEENIAAGLKCGKSEKKQIVHQMIEKFHLDDLGRRLPGELSGGQQQRVALARIMAYEPSAILLDEPFSALDSFLKDQLQQELLEMLRDYKGMIVMVSHNRDEIYRFSEELIIVDDGIAVEQGPTKELFLHPTKRASARLTGCKNCSAARRVDAHHLYLADWDAHIITEQEIPADTVRVGYRAHDFVPVWGEKKNGCLRYQRSSKAELPFETNYYIRAAMEGEPDICWFVQGDGIALLAEKGEPDYLQIKEDKLLFLTD